MRTSLMRCIFTSDYINSYSWSIQLTHFIGGSHARMAHKFSLDFFLFISQCSDFNSSEKNVSILLFSHRPQISLQHNQSTQHKCCRSNIGNAFEFDYQISASAIKLICHCVYARRHSKYSVAAAMTAAATTIHQQMRRKRMNERPNERTNAYKCYWHTVHSYK